MDDPIEEEKERLREAAANSAEELKEAVGDLAAAAQSQANGVVETGRWSGSMPDSRLVYSSGCGAERPGARRGAFQWPKKRAIVAK